MDIGIEILRMTLMVVFSTIGAGFAVYKLVDKRFTQMERLAEQRNEKTNDAILVLSKTVAEASGRNMTIESCVINNKESDKRLKEAVKEAETKMHDKLYYETGKSKEGYNRLDVRVSKLEDKAK